MDITAIEKSTRKYSKREETVIDNKSSTLDKNNIKYNQEGLKINQQSMQRLKFKKKIDNKKEIVNIVCTQYAYRK